MRPRSREEEEEAQEHANSKQKMHLRYHKGVVLELPPHHPKSTQTNVPDSAGKVFFDYTEKDEQVMMAELYKSQAALIEVSWNKDLNLFKMFFKADFAKVSQLTLKNNRLTSCEFLAKIDTPLLDELDLSFNFISDARTLAKMDLRSLKKLLMQDNCLVQLDRLCEIYAPKLSVLRFEPRWRKWKLPVTECLVCLAKVHLCSSESDEVISKSVKRLAQPKVVHMIRSKWQAAK